MLDFQKIINLIIESYSLRKGYFENDKKPKCHYDCFTNGELEPKRYGDGESLQYSAAFFFNCLFKIFLE
ncbi:hypothetical protein JCM10003_3699 [Bacteroides pyogenes JCM 10003]|nr:hypothetical protein JCM10003_3699 [Bacteroides pyogenes JCM 10003]